MVYREDYEELELLKKSDMDTTYMNTWFENKNVFCHILKSLKSDIYIRCHRKQMFSYVCIPADG